MLFREDFFMDAHILTQCRESTLHDIGLDRHARGGFCGTWIGSGKPQQILSPIDGHELAEVVTVRADEMDPIISRSHQVFREWSLVPAPIRGRLVKELGLEIAKNREPLARLITMEMGKCYREAQGEVQEMVDVFDFATGLSRQLYGLTMPSERAGHRLQEQWHPLGVVGVITAFNFPMAVWSWNAALALVCGDTVLWKPSSKTPLCAIACTRIAEQVLTRNGYDPAICSLAIGPGKSIGDRISGDPRVALVSYTGSVSCGRDVGLRVQERFGRHILELGGNNAVIVSCRADLDVALKAVYFGAIGTAGQRCTSTRRVIVHESVHAEFIERLKGMLEGTPIGDPFDSRNLMGPLVDERAVAVMMHALDALVGQGGRIICGGNRLALAGGCYVTPCMAEADNRMPIVQEETFAPILYVMTYRSIDEAIALQNGVPQGLSSSIISDNMSETELFMSACGSDCGIANVNTGTSGAEIGGAFGGEKETGGGRESGSDAWKAYMRRQTNVINYSRQFRLAQGIAFSQ